VNIPKQVNVIDSVIAVEFATMVRELGYADYDNDKIIISENVTESKKEEIFYHELTHWILFKMGSKLECNEDFVSMFASLLNQAMKSTE